MSQTCWLIQGTVYLDCVRRLQTENRKDLPQLSPKMYTNFHVEFNVSIPKFIQVIVKLIFMNLVETSFPALFTINWLSDNSRQIISQILKTMAAELGDI